MLASRASWLRAAPLALAIAFTLPIQACFGSFALTNKIYQFNKSGVSESIIVQEILFLVFLIVPVYEIGLFVDAIILNLIEALTGGNPLASNATVGESQMIALEDGGTLTLTRTEDGIELVRERPDGKTKRHHVRIGSDGVELLDASGRILAGTERLSDGGFRVLDAEGRSLAQPSLEMLADLQRAMLVEGGEGVARVLSSHPDSSTCLAYAQ